MNVGISSLHIGHLYSNKSMIYIASNNYMDFNKHGKAKRPFKLKRHRLAKEIERNQRNTFNLLREFPRDRTRYLHTSLQKVREMVKRGNVTTALEAMRSSLKRDNVRLFTTNLPKLEEKVPIISEKLESTELVHKTPINSEIIKSESNSVAMKTKKPGVYSNLKNTNFYLKELAKKETIRYDYIYPRTLRQAKIN